MLVTLSLLTEQKQFSWTLTQPRVDTASTKQISFFLCDEMFVFYITKSLITELFHMHANDLTAFQLKSLIICI